MTAKPKPSYQDLNQELESLLVDLQREDMDIDTALSQYKRGLELIKQLEDYLQKAETKIIQIKSKTSDTK